MQRLFAIAIVTLGLLHAGCARPENPANSNTAANSNGSANANGARQGTGVSDAVVTAKIKLALIADERTSGFTTDVDTKDGIVTLSGKVDTAEAKSAAEEVVVKIDGVSRVDNQLQVVPEGRRDAVAATDEKIDDAIERAMNNDPVLGEMSLSAKSNQGVVTLDGTADSEEQLLKAATVIRKIPGVKSVVTTPVTVVGGN